MKTNPWGLIGKSTVMVATLVLLWRVNTTMASILGLVVGLCLIAYWGDSANRSAAREKLSIDDFRRQLEMDSLKKEYSR